MTYIEFFDRESTENICASLTDIPERIVFVGDGSRLMNSYAKRYRKLFLRRGYDVEIVCKSVNKHDLQALVDILCFLASTCKDCVFDITGGEETVILAMGIVLERMKDNNIKVVRSDIKTGIVYEIDKNGKTALQNKPFMSVEENILVHGGKVVYSDTDPDGTVKWSFDNDFGQDIDKAWEICRKNAKVWNSQISLLECAEKVNLSVGDELFTRAKLSDMREQGESARIVFSKALIDKLKHAGLITYFRLSGNTVEVKYKNVQIKRLLTTAGLCLELKVYALAKEIQDDDAKPYFYDVMNGVYIDWDGLNVENTEDTGTKNEIDVMLMRGLVPVFISCKNGIVETDELYKLNTVARRFGGKYASQALFASDLSRIRRTAPFFKSRASDMKICVVDNVCRMSDGEIKRALKSLV